MSNPDLATQLIRSGLLQPSELPQDRDLQGWLKQTQAIPRPLVAQIEQSDPLRLGPYEVLGRLGRGAMGLVLKARDQRLDRIVALKILPPSRTDKLSSRLRREAISMARLQHEHVVSVYGLEDLDGELVLAMEFVDGASLESRLESGTLPEGEVWKLLEHVSSALAHAEGHGLIHRDLKPGNIMCQDGPNGVTYRVCDFGLAKDFRGSDLETKLTQSGTLVGTPLYASPEQLRGSAQLDCRTDMFSLGLTATEALTGSVSGEGVGLIQLLSLRLEQSVPDPREARPETSEDLADLLLDLTELDPAARPASWNHVHQRVLKQRLGHPEDPSTPSVGGFKISAAGMLIGALVLGVLAFVAVLSPSETAYPPADRGAEVTDASEHADEPQVVGDEEAAPESDPAPDPLPDLTEIMRPKLVIEEADKEPLHPNDPYVHSSGSWQQDHADQWGLKSLRLGSADLPWPQQGTELVVAVVDSGVDFDHPELQGKAWTNPGEVPNNGIDDDRNGYVDDCFGFNFADKSPDVRDFLGQGTFVAGLIAANSNNGQGIAGIASSVKIMALRTSNSRGIRSSAVSASLEYAVKNGARVVVIGSGGQTTRGFLAALRLAEKAGVLVVCGSGNRGAELGRSQQAAQPWVISVAALTPRESRWEASGWGKAVDLCAPGVEILSLRAKNTDLARAFGGKARASFVGPESRYCVCGGTAFAAAYTAGAIAYVWGLRPELNASQIRRVVLHSARDVAEPGVDQHTGYGCVDVVAARSADPNLFILAELEGVEPGPGKSVRVSGTAHADDFVGASLSIGRGERPERWTHLSRIPAPVERGHLASFSHRALSSPGTWILRLEVDHRSGRSREVRFRIDAE